jgi:putative SOS response-associated peptidase YedK
MFYPPIAALDEAFKLHEMCNRYRMSAKQVDLARAFGVKEHLIMPEPEPLPPPELFPKRIGWVVRNQDGTRTVDAMAWGIYLVK